MKLSFEAPSIKRKQQAIEYIKEFHEYNSAINGTGGLDIEDYDNWLVKTTNSSKGINVHKDRVPASTFFVFDENDILVGTVNIRHTLNEYLLQSGSGHIGYGVRPTERRKGYASEILRKALNISKHAFKIDEVLVGCYEENIGSKKTILNNGGVFKEKILDEEGKTTLAFLIQTI